MIGRWVARLASILALLAASPPLQGQATARQATAPPAAGPAIPAAAAQEGTLSVTLVTFGPGEQVFERFGHNALRVRDDALGTDVAYDWGNFDFQQPGFLRRFLTGDTRYSMERRDARLMIEAYRNIGRPVTLQRLNLTPEQAERLRDFLEWNAREENKFYRYDYFLDNCSTRLRDALDQVLGGALRRATDAQPTTLSYRRESVRLTDGDKPVQAGIDVALGRPADAPLTVWGSFFIPMRLRDAVRELRVPAGPAGTSLAFVAEERQLAPAAGVSVVAERAVAPRLVFRFAAVGLVLAALVVGLRIMAVSRRGAAWGLALVGAVWSLVCGVVAVLILLAWTATKHQFWGWNENLFQLSPLSLALVVLLPIAVLRGTRVRATRMVAGAVVAVGVLGALLALLPGGQESRAVVALVLPVHLALAWAVALPRPTIRRVPTPA